MIKTNYLQGGSYNAIDLVNQFDALFADGTLGGGYVAAHGPNNLSVDVPIVQCIKAGLFLNNDGVVVVPITANTSGYNRIDVICADLDNSEVIAVMGTPSSSPTAPILTGNKIALSQVLVGNNVSVINQGNITDVRVNAEIANNAHLFASSGYLKLPNGFILQWAGVTVAGDTASHPFNLPIVFPNACLMAVASIWDFTNLSTSSACRMVSFGTSTITIANSTTSVNKASYIAIGW